MLVATCLVDCSLCVSNAREFTQLVTNMLIIQKLCPNPNGTTRR